LILIFLTDMKTKNIDNYYFANSPMAFEIVKSHYYSDIKSENDYSDKFGYFTQLQRDGIVIIPNFLSEFDIQSITDEISDIFLVRDGIYSGNNQSLLYSEDGKCGLEINSNMPYTYNFLVKNILINSLAQAYHGKQIKLTTTVVHLKYGINSRDEANELHIDDWKIRLKAFYLLSNVTNENAPLIYYKGSHLDTLWQRNQFYVKWAYPYNCGTPSYLISDLIKEYNFEEFVCVAPKGSVILFDGRGLHTGTLLRKDFRLLLESIYSKESSNFCIS